MVGEVWKEERKKRGRWRGRRKEKKSEEKRERGGGRRDMVCEEEGTRRKGGKKEEKGKRIKLQGNVHVLTFGFSHSRSV